MSYRSDMESHIGAMLDGTLAGAEAIRFLESQRPEYLKPEEVAGAVDAVMARALPFSEFPEAIDCCGTGGDGRLTYNISTAAALVVASRGVKVAKHGNRAVTSQSGSVDVLEALGVNTHVTNTAAERLLNEIGIAFLYAPNFHPGFAQVSPIRKAVSHRTIFNLIGPLCNPARVRRQIIGVYAIELCSLIAETCQVLGREKVLVVHGEDGTDEISVTGNTHITQLEQGQIRHSSFRPQEAGILPHPGRALVGGTAKQNAIALRDVLNGVDSPYADAVIINAAGALLVAGKAPSLYEGATLARTAIARGDAARKLEELIEASFADE